MRGLWTEPEDFIDDGMILGDRARYEGAVGSLAELEPQVQLQHQEIAEELGPEEGPGSPERNDSRSGRSPACQAASN